MTLRIEKPGLLSSFQDKGRWGHQHLGVSVTGAMDVQAHHVANLLVGNEKDWATLEMTLIGPTIQFEKSCCISLTGADMDARCDGRRIVPYRPILIQAGQTLKLGTTKTGARTYMAVHGGFNLPVVMGSQSTYLRAGLGGWQGRALRKGDSIDINRSLPDDTAMLKDLAERVWQQSIYLPSAIGQLTGRKSLVRIIRSHLWGEFTPDSCASLLATEWRICTESERMGYRLEGPRLEMAQSRQMISEGAAFGTIQVPGSGQPIILMADRQTTGGYPKIATVASVDLPILAQKKPGDLVRFTLIDHSQAQRLDAVREEAFAVLRVDMARVRQLLSEALEPETIEQKGIAIEPEA